MKLKKTDLFTFIHKALRSLIYNAGSKLQNTDFGNRQESEIFVDLLKEDLDLLHEHAEHEDNIIFPEVKNQEPRMIEILEEEHKQIGGKLNTLYKLIDEIKVEEDNEQRLDKGERLNNLFNEFAAAYLSHMNHEETTVLGASWKYLTDEELVAIRTRIQTKIPSERYKVWLNWMLLSLNNSELITLLGGMKASAPPHIFENVANTAKNIIDPVRWEKLSSKLLS